jgi:hypothetical protein
MYVCNAMYVRMYVRTYVCKYVCMYVFFYIFIGMLHYIVLVILQAVTFGVYILYSFFFLLTFYVLLSVVLCSVFISLNLSSFCVNFANVL